MIITCDCAIETILNDVGCPSLMCDECWTKSSLNDHNKSFCFYSETMERRWPYRVVYKMADDALCDISIAMERFDTEQLFRLPSDIVYIGRGQPFRTLEKKILNISQQIIKMTLDLIIHD